MRTCTWHRCGVPAQNLRRLLWLVLMFGWALAAGPAALAGTIASPLPPRPAAAPAPQEQGQQPQEALHSVPSFLASLPPAGRHATPHAMLRDAQAARGTPAMARNGR